MYRAKGEKKKGGKRKQGRAAREKEESVDTMSAVAPKICSRNNDNVEVVVQSIGTC